jgi:hypothetical protein
LRSFAACVAFDQRMLSWLPGSPHRVGPKGRSPVRAAGRGGAALTTRAAMAYLHGSDERQQVIADALSSRGGRDGTVRDEAIGHAAGTAVGESVMNIAGQRSNVGTDLRFSCGAPGRIRTRDPLLRRYRWSVAGRRLTSLYKPSSSSYFRLLSEGVARRRSPSAHQLAHQNLLTFANVRIDENNVD